jgi:complement component 1 Q subcomponent-binding protein, mitochondrial
VDNPGEGILQLKRQFEDETIIVQVDITDVSPQLREDKDDIPSFIPLVVSVFKGNGACLEFGVIAYRNRDYVMISRMSLKKPDESEDPLAYNERRFR